MKKAFFIAVLCGAVITARPAWAQKAATPEEVVQKTRQAAQYLAQDKTNGLITFSRRTSEYVWADSYVFVVDCQQKRIVAHPINHTLIGQNIAFLKDPTGKLFGPMLCEGDKARGHWIEYSWPKPDEEKPVRKLTYLEPVPGTPYRVGAGVYNETMSLDQLQALSSK
jgi:signal transduction histidine kinase